MFRWFFLYQNWEFSKKKCKTKSRIKSSKYSPKILINSPFEYPPNQQPRWTARTLGKLQEILKFYFGLVFSQKRTKLLETQMATRSSILNFEPYELNWLWSVLDFVHKVLVELSFLRNLPVINMLIVVLILLIVVSLPPLSFWVQ